MSRKLPMQPEGRPVEVTGQAGAGLPWVPAPEIEVPEEGGSFNWRRVGSALARYKWLVLLVTAVGAAGGVFGSRYVKPQYVAQATIWIESTTQSAANRGPIRSDELLQSTAWVELLKSYVVLDHVIRGMRLYLSPGSSADTAVLSTFALKDRFRPGEYRLTVDRSGRSFELATRSGTVLHRGAVGDSVGPDLGFSWVPPAGRLEAGGRADFTVLTPREAALRLSTDLQTEMRERGNFLSLALSGTDPERLARTLNAVAERFVEVAAELKRSKLDELTAILNEQLRSSASELTAAEASLEGFRVQTITLPSEPAMPVPAGLEFTRNPVFGNYFGMKVELEQLRRDREAIERALSDAQRSGLTVAALEVVGSVQQSSELSRSLQELTGLRAELRALRHQYTDEYPAVRRLLAQIDTLEQRTVPQLATTLLSELGVRDAELNGMVRSVSGELQQIPPRAIEEARLQRQVAIQDNLYTNLRARYEEARLAAESSIPDVRILDHAVAPQRPAKNPAPQVILMAALGSFGLALVGAVLLDRIDPRLRYPEQITQDMGLPILGAVPHVRNRNGAGSLQNAAEVIEAFRGIRLNLTHAAGAVGGPLVVTISSPGSGDGKSFVSSNLALAFAEQGQRTLLIDGDIRRGALHRLLHGNRKPGLTDYLAGRAGREEIVQATSYPALHLIGCGTRMKSGPELLSTPPMHELVERMRSLYTVVIIDTPPLGAGIDPYVFGTITGNLLLVLRTGATNRELAEAKLDLLDRLPVRTLGAILNDVSPHGLYSYYYRHYSYLPGYEAEEEQEAAAPQLPGTPA